MINELKEKASKWSEQLANEFHNNVPRVSPYKGGFVWEVHDTGFYHWGSDAVDFYKLDGTVYSLQKKWYELDWKMHTELYRYSSQSKKFRISKPLTYQTIDLNGEEWTYTEIQYPGKEQGYPCWAKLILEDPTLASKGYIDDIATLLQYLDMLDEKYHCGYPSKVKLGNRLKDRFGYFWKDIKYWGHTREDFVRKHVGEVQKISDHASNNGLSLLVDMTEYARSAWTN